MSGRDFTMYTASGEADGERDSQEAAVQDVPLGTTIGRYVVVERLGHGGMGVVYGVYDPQLDRKIAFKLLHPKRSGKTAAEYQERLLREAQALARISHPNVIAVHDVGTFGNRIFVAMEYLEGENLQQWPKRGADWRAVLAAYVQAGRGLDAAHRAGLVHRDFKPENAFRCTDGRVKVLDFGLARLDEHPIDPASGSKPAAIDRTGHLESTPPIGEGGSVRVTKPGAIVGTPAFMAPEQWAGAEIDARTDQFSFCASLYEGLFHQRPFSGETAPSLAYQVKTKAVRDPPPGSKVPKWLLRAILRGLEPEPAKRWPSMGALLAELERDRGARVRRIAAAAAVVAIAGGAWGFVAYSESQRLAVCADASERLDGVWDAARRDRTATAFAATKLSYAGDSHARVSAGLDGYAKKWTDAYGDACRASHLVGDQASRYHELRLACLEERRLELSTLVGVFEQADAAAVERSVEAVANLSPIEGCEDTSAALAELQPPKDPAAAALVEQAHEELAQARPLLKSARYQEGIEHAAAALALAERAEYPPAQAEAHAVRGSLEHAAGRFDEAATDLQEAVWMGTASRHDEVVLQATTLLSQLDGYERANFEAGMRWARHGQAILERLGGGPRDEAQIENALGAIHLAHKDFPAARDHYQRSLDLYRGLETPDAAARARVLNNLGTAHLELGDFELGTQQYEEALRIFEETYGPRHPMTAKGLNNLGVAYERLGKLDEAAKHQRRALEIKVEIMGERHPSVAGSLGNLANLYIAQGQPAEALEYYQRARDIFAAAIGPKHPNVAECHQGVARAEAELGRYAESIADFEQAIAVYGEHPTAARNLAESRLGLARSLAKTPGGLARAIAEAKLAREYFAANAGDNAESLAAVDTFLAAPPTK